MKRKSKTFYFVPKILLISFAVVVLSCLCPLQGGLSTHVFAAPQPKEATWVWNTYSIWKDKDKTLDFLTKNRVNLIYLQIDPDIPNNVYRTFIREATNRGIEVQALGGAPDWVLPEHQKKMYQFIYWVTTYNKSVVPAERFNGIHLDVEAHVLPQFKSDKDRVIGLWMDTISGFVQEVKSEDPTLTAGADLPAWLHIFNVHDGHGGTETLSSWMCGKLDQVTLMAYVDNAQGIIQASSISLSEAEKAGKPVIVAVETMNSSEPNISFYSKGKNKMMSELEKVKSALSSNTSFSGIAIHHYESWSSLRD
ncbi:hypothetical protein PP175_17640 [Aneurinibacillus sp. Ricciae_BoGa-3]|uniref:hypothetical protein n=1 Tax=Aneurinibacillus sp. Ricciae_BoGa-3 TaxID=3022697 RepID=UPI002341922B|nr:hypothetical protein [Aneurinibacillus sp. Ricciae_BoGa-3]WCK53215.1 hypothetical protein PP175_17640 [Aneurinibacillus sp. Ricciae_BoGa-3]